MAPRRPRDNGLGAIARASGAKARRGTIGRGRLAPRENPISDGEPRADFPAEQEDGRLNETATNISIYERVGGEAAVERLVEAFYDNMDALPQAADVREMHGPELTEIRKVFKNYLTEWTGGPALYSPRERSSPPAPAPFSLPHRQCGARRLDGLHDQGARRHARRHAGEAGAGGQYRQARRLDAESAVGLPNTGDATVGTSPVGKENARRGQRSDFAPSARQVGRAHQEMIDRAGRLAAFADRPDHQRLAAAHVAGDENLVEAGLVGERVGRTLPRPSSATPRSLIMPSCTGETKPMASRTRSARRSNSDAGNFLHLAIDAHALQRLDHAVLADDLPWS